MTPGGILGAVAQPETGTETWERFEGRCRKGGSADRPLSVWFLSQEDLENGEDVATCPSCSLIIRVIYDKDQFMCGERVPAPSTSKELVKC